MTSSAPSGAGVDAAPTPDPRRQMRAVVGLPWLVSAVTVGVLVATYAGLEAVSADPDEDGLQRSLDQLLNGGAAVAVATIAWGLALRWYVRRHHAVGRRVVVWLTLTGVGGATVLAAVGAIDRWPWLLLPAWLVQQVLLSVTARALHRSAR